MSEIYDRYLTEHKAAVWEAFRWIEENIPQVLADLDKDVNWQIQFGHDASKTDPEEYKAYDDYFYGDKSYAVVQAFNYAWLHHIHENPHHWQHWILVNDDEKDGTKALEIPFEYIIEMICDWWSFSFRSGNLREIFKWYDDHKGRIVMHDRSRKKVEYILGEIKKKLDEDDGIEEVTEEQPVVEVVVAVEPEEETKE